MNRSDIFSFNKYLAQGKNHKSSNIVLQDYCEHYYDKINKFSLIVLSDGAGSCKYSHYGSKTIVNSIIDFFKENYINIFSYSEEEIKLKIVKYLSKDIDSTADKNGFNVKDLYATLLFVFCYKEKYIYGHIGDGIICSDTKSGLKLISKGIGGEFKNETVFFHKDINIDNFLLEIKPIDDILSFYCFSDGLEPILISFKNDKLSEILSTFSYWIDNYEYNYVFDNIKVNLDEIAEETPSIYDDLSLIIMNINTVENIKIRNTNEKIREKKDLESSANISSANNVSKQENISATNNVSKQENISANNISKQENISAANNISKQENISAANNISKQENISATNNVSKQENISATNNVSKQENISAANNVSKQENISAANNISKQENISATNNVSKQENISAANNISKQENTVNCKSNSFEEGYKKVIKPSKEYQHEINKRKEASYKPNSNKKKTDISSYILYFLIIIILLFFIAILSHINDSISKLKNNPSTNNVYELKTDSYIYIKYGSFEEEYGKLLKIVKSMR